MTTPELIQYVKNETDKGVARNIITDNLKTQGWTDRDIVEVYNIINQVPTNKEETIRKAFHISKKTIIVIMSLVIFLFVLFGFFYASGYFLKSNNIFSKFTSSSKEIKNVSYDVDFALDLSDMKMDDDGDIFGDSSKKEINFKVSGISDLSNKDILQFKSLISFEAGKFDGSVDLKMINKIIYFNIISAPEIGVISLSPLENTWVKVPIEEKLNEIMGDSLGIESPINADVLSSLSDEQEKKIVEIVNKASLIKITKRHIPEMVDRSLSYHLEFELDKEGMIKFMKDIESFMVDLNKEEIANISSGNDYDEIFDSLKSFKGEIWIGIFDNLPRKVQIDIVAINPSEPADGSLKFKIAARYYDWNKSVAIEAPAVSITIEEFIEKIMGSMMGGSDFDGIFSPTQEEGLDKV